MTQAEHVLLSLVRRSLFDTEESFPSDIDWDDVYQEAKVQAIVGLTAKVLPDAVPLTVSKEWKKLALSQLANNLRYWKAQDELHQLLTGNGIPYVILKGAAAAMMYPDPFARTMGDIDFLVPPEHYDRAKELLTADGYQPRHEGSDRHFIFSKHNISFELHYRFSYADLDMEDTLLAALARAELHQEAGHAFCLFPARENGLVLLAHLWSHLHTGIGLRQVIDWMMYVQTFVSDDFWNSQFLGLARQCRLETTAITATRMCQKYFHLPLPISWCASADESLADELMETILESGNFGRKQSNRTNAEKKAKTALSDLSRYGFFHHLQNRGEANWHAYQKHPWLKPFAWIYQLFRYAVLWMTMPKHRKLSSLLHKQSETSDLFKHLE